MYCCKSCIHLHALYVDAILRVEYVTRHRNVIGSSFITGNIIQWIRCMYAELQT